MSDPNGPPPANERPPWASGADFQAPGTQPPQQPPPPWASGAPYVQYPPPGAVPVVQMPVQYPPGNPYAAQFVPNAPMLYAVPPVMPMPPQPMEESSSSEEEEDDEEDEHDDFLTGATPPSSPRASATRHVKIRLKIDGASVQENGSELAPLACALTGQRSSGAPLGGNRWGAVGQPSAAPIARQNLVLTQRPFPKFSELQVRVDGVGATSRHRDAVDVAVRESTGRASALRPRRDAVVRRRRRSPAPT